MAYIDITTDDFTDAELIDAIEDRGYVIAHHEEEQNEVNRIVQMHRCGDPQWSKLALKYLYNRAGKVV